MALKDIKGLPELPGIGKKGNRERKWLPLFQAFINELRIQSKEVSAGDGCDERGAKLNLWGSQRMYLEEICKGMDEGVREFLCLKSRQLGVTTVSLAIDLFWLATHPRMIGALVVDNDKNAANFRSILMMYHQSLPSEFIGTSFQLVKSNSTYMEFSNGSRLDFLVAGSRKKTWGEGRAYTLVHSTETSKYGTPEGIASFRECFAEVNPDRLIMWESTAFGMNHWRDMYEAAENDGFTKRAFFIGWWSKEPNSLHRSDNRFKVFGQEPVNAEEREKIKLVRQRHGIEISPEQLAWRRWRDADTSVSKADLDQNQPWLSEEAFVQSGYSFFQVRLLTRILDAIYDPNNGIAYTPYRFYLGNVFHDSRMDLIEPREIERQGSDIVELRVWEQPVDGATYVIGCDPAFGRNDWKDRHAVQVFRCFADKMVQVAEYADNRVETYQAAWVLAYLAGAYKDVIINIELTGPGRAVFRELDDKRTEYRSEYHAKRVEERGWDNFLGSARYYLYSRPDSLGAGYAYHTEMTYSIKSRVLNQFRDALMTNALVLRSAPLINEMMSVVQDGSEISAPGQMKDDRVFASVLACMAWKDWVQAGMIQNGQTYENVVIAEQSEPTKAHSMVRHIVHNFWKTQTEAVMLEESRVPPPTFLDSRGL